ncbi:MAG: helix-turn-helix domain-containing protein [bacterium]
MVGELEEAFLYAEAGNLYKFVIEAAEKPLIEHALMRAEGNQLKAAKILGINRNTLRSKIKKLGIKVK